MIHLFSFCSPSRSSNLVVLNYFGQNISRVCSFEVPPWIVCAILVSLSSNDLPAFLEKSESVLKAQLTSLKGYLFVWLAPLLLFIPCHPLCDFSVNFSLSYSLSLLTFPCCPPFSLISPNPCFRLLIVSLPLCPLFSSHPANFPPLSPPLLTSHLQWTCWTSAWPRTPSSSTSSPTTISWWPFPTSSTAWRPSTTAWSRSTRTWSTCRSALTCVSTGCSTFTTRMYAICLVEDYEFDFFVFWICHRIVIFASSCAKTVFDQIGWKWQNWCISSLHSCIFNPSSLVSSAHNDNVVHIHTLVCFYCQQPICTSWHANGCCMLPLSDTRHVQIHSVPALNNTFAFCKPTWLLVWTLFVVTQKMHYHNQLFSAVKEAAAHTKTHTRTHMHTVEDSSLSKHIMIFCHCCCI